MRRWSMVVAVAFAGSVVAVAASHARLRPVRLAGEEIVFTGGTGTAAGLYLIRQDVSHRRLLARNAAATAISPDGRRIAFVRGNAVWLMAPDGSRQRQLTRPGLARLRGGSVISDGEPAWSSTGSRVYFSRVRDGNQLAFSRGSSIWLVRADGTGLRRVPNTAGADPAWLPRATEAAG